MFPIAYFITFHTYGSWLHGSDKGSVDRENNRPGDEVLPPDGRLESFRRSQMKQPDYRLDPSRRSLVMQAVLEHGEHKQWKIWAIHVRTNHVHIVVTSAQPPERVLMECKAYASRALNQAALDPPDCERWSRHGSTRHLITEDEVAAKIRYVAEGQGEPMELFVRADKG